MGGFPLFMIVTPEILLSKQLAGRVLKRDLDTQLAQLSAINRELQRALRLLAQGPSTPLSL